MCSELSHTLPCIHISTHPCELRERREAVIGKEVCGSVSSTRTLSQHVQRNISWGSVGTVELE